MEVLYWAYTSPARVLSNCMTKVPCFEEVMYTSLVAVQYLC